MSLARWLPPRWRWPYALLWAAVALLLSLAALQDYHRSGGTRDWEPLLWEFSSVLCVALLALAVHALVGRLRGRPWQQQLLAHLAGALVFNVLHVAGMFALRFSVYAAVGLDYDPGPLRELMLYEAAKDIVSYAMLAAISSGLWSAQESARQRDELARTRAELAEARLARLADLVQPHFLFNTLNLISAVMYEDVPRADRLLCDLATLLRQALAAQEQGEHRLEDELALVQPFLALMQARFGDDRLQVQIDASAAARACRLPALLLLAPVENTIKHDVATHTGAVSVRVHAECVHGRLRVAIDNSGVRHEPAAAPDGGSGLRNLRQRLQARYGDAASVHLGPGPAGMRLVLELPAP